MTPVRRVSPAPTQPGPGHTRSRGLLSVFACLALAAGSLAGQELTVEVYDVRALVEELPRALVTGPSSARGADLVLEGASPDGGYRQVLVLMERLKTEVTPEAWMRDGVSMRALDGVLVVSHDASGHMALSAHLDELRVGAASGIRVRVGLSEVSFPGGEELRSLGEVATSVTPGHAGVAWSGEAVAFLQGKMGALASNFAPRMVGDSRRGLAVQVRAAPTPGGTLLSLQVGWASGPPAGELPASRDGIELPSYEVFEWSGMMRVPAGVKDLKQAVVGLPLGPHAFDRGHVLRIEVTPAQPGRATEPGRDPFLDVSDLLMLRRHAAVDQAGGLFDVGLAPGIEPEGLLETIELLCDPEIEGAVALVGSRLHLHGQTEATHQAVAGLLGRLRELLCSGLQLDVSMQRRGTDQALGFVTRLLPGMRVSMRSGRRRTYVGDLGASGEPIQEGVYLGGQLDALVTTSTAGAYAVELGLRWSELAQAGLRTAGTTGSEITLPAVDRGVVSLSVGCQDGEWQPAGTLSLSGVLYDVSVRVTGESR